MKYFKTNKNIHDQHQSLFFALPFEIRLIIYNLIISSSGWGSKIHIVAPIYEMGYKRKIHEKCPKLRVIPCRSSRNHDFVPGLQRGGLLLNNCPECAESEEWCGSSSTGKNGRQGSSIEWMFSGRQMYEEAAKVLYSSLEFELHHSAAVKFLTTVSLRNLNYIQKMGLLFIVPQLDFKPKPLRFVWDRIHRYQMAGIECGEVLRKLTGLRELRIRFFRNTNYDLNERMLLKPLRGYQNPEIFVVELPWVDGWKNTDGLVKDGRAVGVRRFNCDISRRDKTYDGKYCNKYPPKRIFIHPSPAGILCQGCLQLCCFPIYLPFAIGSVLVGYLKEERDYRVRKWRLWRQTKGLD